MDYLLYMRKVEETLIDSELVKDINEGKMYYFFFYVNQSFLIKKAGIVLSFSNTAGQSIKFYPKL